VTAAGKIRADRLGKKQKLPVFVVTATPSVSKSMDRLGKRKKLPGLVVTVTAAGRMSVDRLGKKKASRSCGGSYRRGNPYKVEIS